MATARRPRPRPSDGERWRHPDVAASAGRRPGDGRRRLGGGGIRTWRRRPGGDQATAGVG
ncbi:hypothetical protein DAI22_08g240600 [Oryza sativa Japonica Group]|nr:hypothetical protein DAI22_08g240600 [Oryza sativa Japonica Group]